MSRGSASIPAANGKGKVRLLTRRDLDGRTRARKQFDTIARGIAADLGGQKDLSTVQCLLIEAFAGCAVTLNEINTRALKGETIDLSAYAQTVSTLVRVATRLGTKRVPRDVTPTLGQVLRDDLRRQREEAS
jgi:hypothetical protein